MAAVIDGIPLALLTGGAPAIGWSLAAGAVWMILTGRLVPRSLYQEQKTIAEMWRTAWQTEREHLTRLAIPNAELQREVLQAIPAPSANGPPQPAQPARSADE